MLMASPFRGAAASARGRECEVSARVVTVRLSPIRSSAGRNDGRRPREGRPAPASGRPAFAPGRSRRSSPRCKVEATRRTLYPLTERRARRPTRLRLVLRRPPDLWLCLRGLGRGQQQRGGGQTAEHGVVIHPIVSARTRQGVATGIESTSNVALSALPSVPQFRVAEAAQQRLRHRSDVPAARSAHRTVTLGSRRWSACRRASVTFPGRRPSWG
jgi:hypothetical protein